MRRSDLRPQLGVALRSSLAQRPGAAQPPGASDRYPARIIHWPYLSPLSVNWTFERTVLPRVCSDREVGESRRPTRGRVADFAQPYPPWFVGSNVGARYGRIARLYLPQVLVCVRLLALASLTISLSTLPGPVIAGAQEPACREIAFGQTSQPIASSSSGHDLTVGDFDADGFDDLAISGRQLLNGFRIVWGAEGLFQIVGTPVIGEPRIFGLGGPIVAVDLNGDRADDLVVRNSQGPCVPLISQGPVRSFSRGADVGCSVDTLAPSDVNSDGLGDVFGWRFRGQSDVAVLISDGQGGLEPIPGFRVAAPFGEGASAALGDVDGDGSKDVVFAGPFANYFGYPRALNRSLAVSRGNGLGEFELVDQGQGVWVGGWPYAVAMHDMDRDGRSDAIVIVDERVEIYRGRADASFDPTPISSQAAPGSGLSLTVGDFNGDGFLDIVVNPWQRSDEDRHYRVYRGDGLGGLELDHVITMTGRRSDFSWPMRAGDFNGDGRLDLITLERRTRSDGSLGLSAVLFANSCPARVSLESDPSPLGLGERTQFRARIQNISIDRTLESAQAKAPTDAFLLDQTARLDSGAPCGAGLTCDFGSIPPGGERYADLITVAPSLPDETPIQPEFSKLMGFTWEGGAATARVVRRLKHGVDLVVTAEMLGEPVLGTEVMFDVEVANRGAQTATAVRLDARRALLGVSTGICVADECQLGAIAPGAAVAREFSVALPLEGDPPDLRVSFSASAAEGDSFRQDNAVEIFISTRRPSIQPDGQRFYLADAAAWIIDPGVRHEFLSNQRLRVHTTGAVRQTVGGLTPGAVYSLRVRGTAEPEALARARIRALDRQGRELAALGPRPLDFPETLQTLATVPPDGSIVIELFAEVNEFAVVRGEIAGVLWSLAELRPATPRTLRIPSEYASVQAAIDASADGDVLLVEPGVYRELLDLGDRAIVIESTDGPERTIFDGGQNGDGVAIAATAPRGTAVRGLTIRNATRGVVAKGLATVEGCWITDSGLAVEAADRATVRDNRIEFNTAAVQARDRTEVTNNRIANNGARNRSRPIDLQGEVLFTGNAVTDNRGEGVALRGPGTIRNNVLSGAEQGGIVVFADARGAVVEQNLVVAGNPDYGGGLSIDLGFPAPPGGSAIIVRNNTIATEIGASLNIFGEGTALRLADNILTTRSAGGAVVCESDKLPPAPRNLIFNAAGPVAVGCGAKWESNALVADPLFVAPQFGDFRLRADSPAVDRGQEESQPAADLAGRPRVRDGDGDGTARADLGAYEYQPPPSPARIRSRDSGLSWKKH